MAAWEAWGGISEEVNEASGGKGEDGKWGLEMRMRNGRILVFVDEILIADLR